MTGKVFTPLLLLALCALAAAATVKVSTLANFKADGAALGRLSRLRLALGRFNLGLSYCERVRYRLFLFLSFMVGMGSVSQ